MRELQGKIKLKVIAISSVIVMAFILKNKVRGGNFR